MGIESPDGDAHLVRTTRGSVRADHLCVATNALVPQLLPALTSTLRAERGQVLVTAPLDERPWPRMLRRRRGVVARDPRGRRPLPPALRRRPLP